MGDRHDSDILPLAYGKQHALYLRRSMRIYIGGRFVQKQELRSEGKRPGAQLDDNGEMQL